MWSEDFVPCSEEIQHVGHEQKRVISSIILVHGVYINLKVHNYGHGHPSRQLSSKGGHSATRTKVKQSIHIKGELSPKLTHKKQAIENRNRCTTMEWSVINYLWRVLELI